MPRDRETTRKDELVGRIEKAKGRLQQSSSEIQHRARTSSAVEIAQSIFRQFADDIQLRDLLAKAEALVAKAERASPKAVSKDITPTVTFPDAAPARESLKHAGARKTSSKRARPKKAAPKKTLSKKKKKPVPKRKTKTRA